MAYRILSPREMLNDGKGRLKRAGDNRDSLERALEIIDAALLQHLKSIYPHANAGPYETFKCLQKDHMVDAAERALMDQMHSLRNRSAHANPLYLTPRYVEQYAQVVDRVLKRTGASGSSESTKKKSKSARAKREQRRPVSTNISSAAVQPQPIASALPLPAPPVVIPPPAEIGHPALSQSSVSDQHRDFLSELLAKEIGGVPKHDQANDELLKQLLSQQSYS